MWHWCEIGEKESQRKRVREREREREREKESQRERERERGALGWYSVTQCYLCAVSVASLSITRGERTGCQMLHF